MIILPLFTILISFIFIIFSYASPRLERIINPKTTKEVEQVSTTTTQISIPTSSSSFLPLNFRSINDCELTNLLLISDIDGNLHGVSRLSGNLLWSLPIDKPLVRIQTNNSDATADSSSSSSNILWFVEPYQDGELYYFTPKFGLNKLPTSIKDLVMNSPFSLSNDDKIYTGERKTSLYNININTGEIQNSFGYDKCPINTTTDSSGDRIMIGKTTYELSIHSKLNKNIVWNVTYSQWVPNNIDNDLIMQNQQSLDKLYFTPFHDKSLLAINKDIGTPVWISKLPSLAVNIFDIFKNNNDYILLPHPTKVLNDLQIENNQNLNNDLVFINKTSNLKQWIAMSYINYPTLIKSAPLSKYQLILNNYYQNNHNNMNSIEFLENFNINEDQNDVKEIEGLLSGIHKVFEVSSDSSYQPISRFERREIKRISDGREESEVIQPDVIDDQIPSIIDGIKFPSKNNIGSDIIILPPEELDNYEFDQIKENKNNSVPSSTNSIVKRIFEDVAVLIVLVILILFFGRSNKYIKRLFYDSSSSKIEEIPEYEKIQIIETQPPKKKVTIVEPEEVKEEVKDSASEPQEEPKSLDSISEKSNENEATPETINDTTTNSTESAPAPYKKKKRGSRGQKKRGGRKINKSTSNEPSENNIYDDDDDEEFDDINKEITEIRAHNNEVEEIEKQVEEEVKEEIQKEIMTKSLIQSLPTPIKPQKLHIENNLIISETVLGFGSHGTVVFEGTFENRPVAVKRMLLDFYDIANHEVKLLQESDDHPNVVRYFCSQTSESEKFLYIALELCLCTLENIIELPSKFPNLKIPKRNDILYQLTSGLNYLHSLKIVHRDIKPQNILVSLGKSKIAENNVRLLISDFGLCKKLDNDQSSFRVTTQHAASGTSGWRAPELLLNHEKEPNLFEISPDSISSNNETTSNGSGGKRLTKAIDIFSLGCVFFYILTDGLHPFGDRYLREGNIIKGEYDLSILYKKCPNDKYEAIDLISKLIQFDPSKRPNTTKILSHPLFWSNSKRLEFLLKVSDRFEIERRDPPSELLLKLESKSQKITNLDWHSKFEIEFLDNLKSYRKYHTFKLMDLLRALRNKYHHFNEIPKPLQSKMLPLPDGFYKYFNDKFPNLLIEIYYIVEQELKDEHIFSENFV
ncbi:unnamed protein product [Candida verbasci]|uniref:non-specific serine/threonine protein kinase n=1 Tax=Candida verbasci TaxID=1227364 RepID=A0A9W4TTB5_9ASCO|nr:unnamed protein product [Candida verbasci]